MSKFRRLIFTFAIAFVSTNALAQFTESGISAGFFDSSKEKDINFSEFRLPPLAVLFENAKSNPQILSLEKARQLAEAEVAKQKGTSFLMSQVMQAIAMVLEICGEIVPLLILRPFTNIKAPNKPIGILV